MKTLGFLLSVLFLASLLTACGGGGGGSSASVSPTTHVAGVATPGAVAVVTAK